MAASAGETVPRARITASARSGNPGPVGATSSPSRSSNWSTAMTVAMPAVNPVVTGCGMYSINRPRRSSPMPTRMSPAIRPEVSRPGRPKRVWIGASTTMNAAVGPVTWVREPPSSATTVPATIAV
jgi:hypothetical protein